eukprot:scaffold70218_cov17-Prasinocladus_malaysianus.AAC.2
MEQVKRKHALRFPLHLSWGCSDGQSCAVFVLGLLCCASNAQKRLSHSHNTQHCSPASSFQRTVGLNALHAAIKQQMIHLI